jgi:hypothetical protein
VAVELDALSQPQLLQIARDLGLVLSGNPTPNEVLRTIRATELDESNARGQ